MNTEPKLVAFCGVSGAGKSSLIRRLVKRDDRFRYVQPYTTRSLRIGETDKCNMPQSELAALQASGELVTLNHVYGFWYGTPAHPIFDVFQHGHCPVLDWPIAQVPALSRAVSGRIHVIYVWPPSLAELRHRLGDGRDPRQERLRSALGELRVVRQGRYESLIDDHAVSDDREGEQLIDDVRSRVCRALDCRM